MRDFHRRSKGPRRRKNEIELDVTPLLQRTTGQYDGVALNDGHNEPNQAQNLEEGVCLNLVTTLGASRLDPFFQYPIRMGSRERELYDHRESKSPSHDIADLWPSL
jgi:hypothetical protein